MSDLDAEGVFNELEILAQQFGGECLEVGFWEPAGQPVYVAST